MSRKSLLPGILFFGSVLAAVTFLINWNIQANAANATANRALRIGLVDISKILDSYGKREESQKKLETLQGEKKKEMETKLQELQTLKDKKELLLEGSAERKKIEEDLGKLQYELKAMNKSAVRDLSEMSARLLIQLYGDIVSECVSYAKDEGYDLLLKKEELDLEGAVVPDEVRFNILSQKVVYNVPELDVTPAIISRLAEKYESSSGKSQLR